MELNSEINILYFFLHPSIVLKFRNLCDKNVWDSQLVCGFGALNKLLLYSCLGTHSDVH